MKYSVSDGFKSLSISWSLLSDVMSNISILPTCITHLLAHKQLQWDNQDIPWILKETHTGTQQNDSTCLVCVAGSVHILGHSLVSWVLACCVCVSSLDIDHSLLLLNSPGGLARAMLSRTVCQDTVKSSIIGQKDWPQVSDLMSILKQLGAFLVGEASFTGSCATELIRFCLWWYQALSPTVTLYKWWILYPLIESWVHLSSAGLEHSWWKPPFLTHHLKPPAYLLGLSVTTVNTMSSGVWEQAGQWLPRGWLAHHCTFLPIPFRPLQLFSMVHGD